MSHIFLSPHLDDAILSCGGVLAHLLAQQQAVTVITLFAGLPDPAAPSSDFARYQHQSWGLMEEAYRLRQSEDQAALARLGLTPHWLPWLDAIYRGANDGSAWYYTSNEALFGPIHPAETNLPGALAETVTLYRQKNQPDLTDPLTVYLPLGIGNHVDHQLARQTAPIWPAQGHTVLFYEDYPYIQRHPDQLAPAQKACQALLPAGQTLRPVLRHFSAQTLAQKIEVIAAYRSQMDILFHGPEEMARLVTAFALETGQGQPAERLWAIATNRNTL